MDFYSAYSENAQAEQIEYSALKRHGKLVGLCLLAYTVLQQLFVLLLLFFGLYEPYLENAAFQYSSSVLLVSFACLFVPFFLMSRRRGSPSYWQALPFAFPKSRSLSLMLILGGFAVCVLSNYVALFAETVLSGVGIEEIEPEITESKSALDVFLNFVCAAVSAPLIEEFIFRGVILQPLRRCGEHFAVFVSALLFGLAHGSPSGFVFSFVAGLAMGYAVVISGSLWVGIAIHFCNNFYSVLLSELYSAFPEMGSSLINLILAALVVGGLGCLGALVFTGKFSFGKRGSLSASKRIKGFFFNLPMLAAVGVLLFYISRSVE